VRVTIDAYQPGDEERMKQIAVRAFSRFTRYALDFMLPPEKVKELFYDEAAEYARRAQQGEEGFAVFAARRSRLLVGYIVLRIDKDRSEHFGMKWGEITSLAVDPDYHHQGIGSALISRAMQWFTQQGCDYADVLTDQNNIAAIRAYEAAGFRVIYSALTLSQKLSD